MVHYLPRPRLAYDGSQRLKVNLPDGKPSIFVQCPRLVMNIDALQNAKAGHISEHAVTDQDELDDIEKNGYFIPVREHKGAWYVCLNRGLTNLD